MWGCGRNGFGNLGDSTTTDRSTLVQIGALTSWSSISAGSDYHALAIKTDGTLWSWGSNNAGKLGLGNVTDYSSPKQVGSLSTWGQVSCGYYTLAVK